MHIHRKSAKFRPVSAVLMVIVILITALAVTSCASSPIPNNTPLENEPVEIIPGGSEMDQPDWDSEDSDELDEDWDELDDDWDDLDLEYWEGWEDWDDDFEDWDDNFTYYSNEELEEIGLAYYLANYVEEGKSEGLDAVIENYGCHQEIHIYKNGEFVMAMVYFDGEMYEI